MIYRVAGLIVLLITLALPAQALITGGDDDRPIENPDWPAGAAAVFNVPQRIAYWEGPPFGGGQHHAECRGDTEALNRVLENFAKIESDNKRIVVENGVGTSFWLRPNPNGKQRGKPEMDWRFMVWSASNWQQLSTMPASLNPTDPQDKEKGPSTELLIYTGGNIDWDKVELPEGVTIVDNRLEAHGFTSADGAVLEGSLTDVSTGEAIAGQVALQLVEPQQKGGYKHTQATSVETGADGAWTIKGAPKGWYRIVAASEGYLPRVVGYIRHDGQPRWSNYECKLAKGGEVKGRVTDNAGEPLTEVQVRLTDLSPASGGRYETPNNYETSTDESGEFCFAAAPIGTAAVRIHKPGYCRPGLSPEISVPAEGVDLQMVESSSVTVIVLFESENVPTQYMVEIEPEGGSKVGSWGGSASIDDKNQYTFESIPPGRYTLVGHPNPYSQDEKSEPMELELKGGEAIVKTITVVE